MEEKTQLQETVTIQLFSNTYTSKFTVGKVIDVEKYRAFYTSGYYKNFNSSTALDLVDAISFLNAFFPEVSEDRKVKSLLELNPMDMKEVVDQIDKKVMPWYQSWIDAMRTIKKEESKQDNANG